MKLYELTKQFKEIQELDPELIRDTLDAIELMFNDKAKNIGFVYMNIGANMEAVDAEIKRLQALKKSLSNKQESLKDYLRNNMEACDITKIECELFKITRVSGRSMAVVDDESKIPSEYKKVVESVDKTALLKELKNGPVEGAHLGTTKESIRIY